MVSAFHGGTYGAEFLIFNTTDTALVIDDSSVSPLQINGVAFTNSSANELSVDEYFNVHGDLSNPGYGADLIASSPLSIKETYQSIKNSRTTYGRNEFSIEAPYIQTRDAANKMMQWLSNKIMKPRRSVGLDVFPIPTLQLGDIVEINYSVDNIDQISFAGSKFVVYQIDYSRDESGPSMQVFLSEV
jgi:hypothetical protein